LIFSAGLENVSAQDSPENTNDESRAIVIFFIFPASFIKLYYGGSWRSP